MLYAFGVCIHLTIVSLEKIEYPYQDLEIPKMYFVAPQKLRQFLRNMHLLNVCF